MTMLESAQLKIIHVFSFMFYNMTDGQPPSFEGSYDIDSFVG